MEDYQGRDVMNRYKYPIVEAEIGYERVHSPTEYQFRLILKLVNKGVITAKAFGMDLFFPNISSPFLTGNESRIITLIDEEYPIYDGNTFTNSGSPATHLFPGQ